MAGMIDPVTDSDRDEILNNIRGAFRSKDFEIDVIFPDLWQSPEHARLWRPPHRDCGKHITAHADDKRSAFVELDSAVRKNGIDIIGGKLTRFPSR